MRAFMRASETGAAHAPLPKPAGSLAMLRAVTDPPRVLILSASVGSGHVAAGKALHTALCAQGAHAEHIDLLEYSSLPFRRLYRQAYLDLIRTMPDLVEWLGRRFDRNPSEYKGVQERLRARVTRLLSYEVPGLIDRYRPDALVHTHFLGAEIVSGRIRRRRPLPQAEVITDFSAHAFWLQPGIARYFVASDDVRAQLLAAGVDDHRIRVTGIPIDPRFAALPDKATARTALGLAQDSDVLLLLANGLGGETLRGVVEQLIALRSPLQVVIVCGHSQELLERSKDLAAGASAPVSVRVLGFTDAMPTLMAAADVTITKPGGMTSSEALAAGLPMIIASPYPLQEEVNANVLLEQGAAVRVAPITTLGHKLKRLLAAPDRIAEMRVNCAGLARPASAAAVAECVLQELVVRGRER